MIEEPAITLPVAARRNRIRALSAEPRDRRRIDNYRGRQWAGVHAFAGRRDRSVAAGDFRDRLYVAGCAGCRRARQTRWRYEV